LLLAHGPNGVGQDDLEKHSGAMIVGGHDRQSDIDPSKIVWVPRTGCKLTMSLKNARAVGPDKLPLCRAQKSELPGVTGGTLQRRQVS
jgi:hypothetical protein